jgi:NADPH2:quinone reductase
LVIVRAARLHEHGSPLSIDEVELDEPDAAAGEVLVEMAFAGVNPVDRYQMLGRVAPEAPLPRTLGSEGAGWVGERAVLLDRGAPARRDEGIWATRVVAKASALVDIPEGVPLEEAAAVGIVGVTAWRCVVDVGAVTAADRVLVLGASGGVGSAIISLASSIGAEVVAQTGSPAKRAFLEQRRPARIIVAGAAEIESALAGWAPTVVIDPLGGPFTGAAIAVLEPRGRLVLFGTSADPTGEVPLQALYRKALSLLGYGGLIESPESLREATELALGALAEGRMEIPVEALVPLERVNDAFSALAERRVQGKQILDLRG